MEDQKPWLGVVTELGTRSRRGIKPIGVASRSFDWEGEPNHKSHAMTSSENFEKGSFCGAKISSEF